MEMRIVKNQRMVLIYKLLWFGRVGVLLGFESVKSQNIFSLTTMIRRELVVQLFR